MVETSFSFTGNESLFPQQKNRKKKKHFSVPFSFFGMCVFFVFLILCALCFQSPVGNSLVLKSPSSFSPRGKSTRWICKLLLDSPLDRKKIKMFPVTAKYCSRVLYLGWWCYTGGGRGESSTPKQCKAIWVLTKALKQIIIKKKSISDQVFWLEQRLKLLLQTDQWGCVWAEGGRKHPCQAGCYGSVRGAVSGYGISRWSPLHSACGGKNIFKRHIAAWCINSGHRWPEKSALGGMWHERRATGFMLHSDQSFPGTPDWLGSRTGTGPGGKQRHVKSVTDNKDKDSVN